MPPLKTVTASNINLFLEFNKDELNMRHFEEGLLVQERKKLKGE
jgi:hypothetical protein